MYIYIHGVYIPYTYFPGKGMIYYSDESRNTCPLLAMAFSSKSKPLRPHKKHWTVGGGGNTVSFSKEGMVTVMGAALPLVPGVRVHCFILMRKCTTVVERIRFSISCTHWVWRDCCLPWGSVYLLAHWECTHA